MTIRVERRPELDLTIFFVQGQTSLEEQIAELKEFYEHDPSHDVVWDFTNVEGTRLSPNDIRAIVDFIAKYAAVRPAGHTALVAPTDVDFGMSRMSATLAEAVSLPWSMAAFRSWDEALAWLRECRRLEGPDR